MSAQDIYNRLAAAPTFHPATVDLFAEDWGLEPGDIVTVKSGETGYSVPVYGMSLDWRGSSAVQIQSTGNQERKPLSALKRKRYSSGRSAHDDLLEAVDGIHSEINQQDEKIELVVVETAQGNKVNAASIVLGINSQDKQSSSYVDISADYINITGIVTSTEMDTRLMKADQIFLQTGYAGKIYVGGVEGSNRIFAPTVEGTYVQGKQLWLLDDENDRSIRITGFGICDLEIQGPVSNVYTLRKKTYASPTEWSVVGTFSRATALEGAWDSGTYTVSASPQGNTNSTQLTVTGHWGDPENHELATTYYGSIYGTVGNTLVDTGKSFTANALSLVGVSTVTEETSTSSAYNAAAAADKWGTLNGDTYYCVTATPVTGTAVKKYFKTPASSSGTITTITKNSQTYDTDLEAFTVSVTASGTNVSSKTSDISVQAEVTITQGNWTSNSSQKTVTAKLNGTNITSVTVSAPSVDCTYANADTAQPSSYWGTLRAGHQYRFTLKRGSSTVWNKYIKVTT